MIKVNQLIYSRAEVVLISVGSMQSFTQTKKNQLIWGEGGDEFICGERSNGEKMLMTGLREEQKVILVGGGGGGDNKRFQKVRKMTEFLLINPRILTFSDRMEALVVTHTIVYGIPVGVLKAGNSLSATSTALSSRNPSYSSRE